VGDDDESVDGGGLVDKIQVNLLHGDAPAARRYDPALEYAAEKEQFGAIRRGALVRALLPG
jgi:hypothetical protein